MWKKGRGELGSLGPLLGRWVAVAESPQGKVRCVRTFSRVLGGAYVKLAVLWNYGGKTEGG
jgi:hypothetical protein